MATKWDYSLYPDVTPPDLDSPTATKYERADYLHRLCTQADFGFFPSGEEIEALADWKSIFDEFQLLDSPTYHALRVYFGWEELEQTPPLPHQKMPWQLQDEREGRIELVSI